MADTNLLITGGGGFVGCRLAHRLGLGDFRYDVTALVHSTSGPGLMRLSRLPLDIQVGDIEDSDRMEELLEECDIVVNCAFGMGSMSETGTRVLLETANKFDIDTFVHLSSAVVHGHDLQNDIDESADFAPDTEYAKWKARAERVVTDFQSQNSLDPIILRPFIVYGPYSDWITRSVEQLRDGVILTDGGGGPFNQIHVENLIDIILLSIENPAARGEEFLVVDDDDVSWHQFFNDLSPAVAGHPPIKSKSWRQIRILRKMRLMEDSFVPPIRAVNRVLHQETVRDTVVEELSQTPWAEPAIKRLPNPVKNAIIDRLNESPTEISAETLEGPHRKSSRDERGSHSGVKRSPQYQLPTRRYMYMHSTGGKISNQKAKDVLGWEPRMSYETGMDQVYEWLEFDHII